MLGGFKTKTTSIEQQQFRYDPPDVTKFTVQIADSSHLHLRATLDHFFNMPSSVTIYQGTDSVVLTDNGVFPDLISDDNIYSSTVQVDISKFVLDVSSRNTKLMDKGSYIIYDGHNGEVIDSVTPFDVNGFLAGLEVEMNQGLIAMSDCSNELFKHKSLFITDLSVVEDPARTFNFIDETGNPNGLYTFGNMMKNMANTSVTNVSTKDFIKSWIKSYTIDVTTTNSFSGAVNKREEVLKFLIIPWLTKAENPNAYKMDFSITLANWETRWNAASENELLKWAPFRLTAISNRLDLRGNGIWVANLHELNYGTSYFDAYMSHKMQAGEIRFIYTLVNLLRDNEYESSSDIKKGEIPTNLNGDFADADFLDWQGMNVILEYLNPHDKTCDLIDFAHSWLNLSELEFGEDFNYALEQLTSQVINANAMATMPNGSALGRLRTNEKIFFPAQSNNSGTWVPSDWQFRQFEIDGTSHLFNMVPTTNAPILEYYSTPYNLPTTGAISTNLTDWLFTPYNKWLVQRERHLLPLDYQGIPLTDMAATNNREFTFYVDLPYNNSTTYFDPAIEANQNNAMAKNIRHKLSLNTCQGCHGGENKTLFTMISPLKFGEEAKYWETTPSTKYGRIDVRLNAAPANITVVNPNAGKTQEDINPATQQNYSPTPNYNLLPATNRDYIIVSAFITGRTYDGTNFQDDEVHELNAVENNPRQDDQMNGLFYVNDPTNTENDTDPNNYFGYNNRKNGFNELERRSKDLCGFLVECDEINPIWIFQQMQHRPLSE